MGKGQFDHPWVCKCLGEFIGTYFLVLTVGCNVLTGSVGAALSIGAMLMAMVYAIGPVSGAHLNPAVTIAGVIAGQFKLNTLVYILFQLAGAIAAAVTHGLLIGTSFTLAPVGQYHWAVAGLFEVLYTAALCYVVLNVATVQSKAGNHFFGLAIGFTVVAAAMSIGGISGCALNPAVTFGAMVVNMLDNGFWASFYYFPLYFFAPIIGGALGAGLFMGTNPGEKALRQQQQ